MTDELTPDERRIIIVNTVASARQMIEHWKGEKFTQVHIDRLAQKLKVIRQTANGAQGKRPHPPHDGQTTKAARIALKREVLAAYGGKCACCGESDERALTLDHVQPLKGKARQDAYKQAKAAGYPPKFQVLCLNCNHMKGTDAVCPHQQRKDQ